MSRMATVLERQKLSLLNSMETDGADVLSDVVVAGKSIPNPPLSPEAIADIHIFQQQMPLTELPMVRISQSR